MYCATLDAKQDFDRCSWKVIFSSLSLINDKEEWVQPAVVRLQATQEPGGGRQGQRRRREQLGLSPTSFFYGFLADLSKGLLPSHLTQSQEQLTQHNTNQTNSDSDSGVDLPVLVS